jgi:hypothetical protein
MKDPVLAGRAVDLRDVSRRVLQSEDSFIQSTVLVWKQRVGDSPLALLTAFDKQIRQDTSVAAKFNAPHTVAVGSQSGALESFQLTAQDRTMQGYLLAFIRDNVMVLVLETARHSQRATDSVPCSTDRSTPSVNFAQVRCLVSTAREVVGEKYKTRSAE